jgi:phosphoribosyl 1,2-cyclic phosphodiesterase
MELEFLGVRGSMPVSGDDRNKYGGHTLCSCIVTSDGEWIIIDAGTGISKLGDIFASQGKEKPQNHHLLLTHFHLDHITGLPFFAPLYSSKVTINFHTPYEPEETEEYLSGLMAGRYFPIEFKETPSKKIFKRIPENSFQIGGADISSIPLNHPQGSVSYKIQDKGKTIVLATDTEHPEKGSDQKLVSFVRGADILVYDAMFTPEEYESGRQGWGHSTWLAGTKVAEEANIGTLYLSHFNPDHSDKQIDDIISLARKRFSQTYGAREGHKEIL